MEWTSLHPLDVNRVRDYLAKLQPIPDTPGELTLGLARFLAARDVAFVQPGLSLSSLEARIDRGIGMLMRPPSRLFMDAGLDPVIAHQLPIRLDMQAGSMGGAFIPARLIPDVQRLLDARMARILRRLGEAEYAAIPTLGLLIEAVDNVAGRGLGLYEAIDAIAPDEPASWPSGAKIVTADPKRLGRDLRKRLEVAAKPEKQPGLLKRLTGRSS